MHEKYTKKYEKYQKLHETTDCANKKEYAWNCEKCAKKKAKYIKIIH